MNLAELTRKITGDDRPVFIVAVGLPGSGKTTFINKLVSSLTGNDRIVTVASTDDLIEVEAGRLGLNYSQAFHRVDFKQIQAEFTKIISNGVAANTDVIIDRTSVGPKTRRTMLNLASNDYRKIALVFSVLDDVLKSRLKTRADATGKFIPDSVIDVMSKAYVAPTQAEGFDDVWDV